MSKPPGLWIAIGGGSVAEAIERSIETDECFSTVVSSRDVRPRDAELAMVALHGDTANYLAISQIGRRIATGQVTIMVSNLIDLRDLRKSTIRDSLPAKFRGRFDPPKSGFYRPTPRLWEEILAVVRTQRPELAARANDLRHIVAGSRRVSVRVEGGLEVLERDAVATSLQAWGGTAVRKKALRGANPKRTSPVAPFLSQLKGVSLREDPQVIHDHATFPGMNIARRDVVGSVVFTDPHGENYLTILNCNRQPLERTLGVDLIYYNHRFDSFVLVQYKRMTTRREGIAEYRPDNDPNHDKELQRMLDAEKVLREVRTRGRGTNSFRLSRRPFFMKLCESKAKAALDSGMVSGMYIPLGLWRRQLRSPETRGHRGGVVMNWNTCKRRFNNSEFTNLLRYGWIGSAAGQSELLSKIVEEVLGSGRMLVLAATSAGVSPLDFRRDGLGRFAADDDPAGST